MFHFTMFHFLPKLKYFNIIGLNNMTRSTTINTIHMYSQQRLQSACIAIKYSIQITHLQTFTNNIIYIVGASIPRSAQQKLTGSIHAFVVLLVKQWTMKIKICDWFSFYLIIHFKVADTMVINFFHAEKF